jgi:hypothetical protein
VKKGDNVIDGSTTRISLGEKETIRLVLGLSLCIFMPFHNMHLLPGTDVMIFKIFSPKYSAKKWRF